MENLQMLIAGIFAVLGLLLLLNFIMLVKITQIQNSQKRKPNFANDGKKHGNNPNKKHEPRQNQNNNRPQSQANANNKSQTNAQSGEKKYEKIGSNAQSLKETNTQLAGRPRPQQTNKKVYSERPAGNAATNANNNQQKQERPANAPIKQQELPKAEVAATPEQSLKPAIEKTAEIKAENIAEVVAEVKTEAASVQYGRR